jgi:lysophospholipase L1-like esterase
VPESVIYGEPGRVERIVRRLLLIVSLALSGCASAATITPMPSDLSEPTAAPAGPDSAVPVAPLRYVALGDSYTIGTSVAARERWPNLLVEAVGRERLVLVENLAVNGWRSRDVLDVQVPRLASLRPAFVSLLVGVNDVVQGVPPATFRIHAAAILDAVLAEVPANRVVVVSTPDYTVTPAGADYGDPDRQRAGIVENNAILAALSRERGVAYVDIFDISSEAATDRSLVAVDGLHPSGAQYARWVERIAPVVERLLAPGGQAD